MISFLTTPYEEAVVYCAWCGNEAVLCEGNSVTPNRLSQPAGYDVRCKKCGWKTMPYSDPQLALEECLRTGKVLPAEHPPERMEECDYSNKAEHLERPSASCAPGLRLHEPVGMEKTCGFGSRCRTSTPK